MDSKEDLIRRYAKKIYGFAYSKTHHTQDAEDLAQEILAALCAAAAAPDIAYMDAYIYRVCCYTWSKFLRRNKPHWEARNNETAFEVLPAGETVENELAEQELYEALRREVMYLSRTRREILILFYYDNRSGDEIARQLALSPSTVRWHLRRARSELKERLDMNVSQGLYRPVRLNVGHSGWVREYDMNGLCSDILMQNLCYVCYGKAKTVEEMARTLGVAAVYLEDKIEKLLYMDYLEKVGAGRYRTNFFIRDKRFKTAREMFRYKNIPPLALQFYETVRAALPDIRRIGFIGCEAGDEELLWNLLPFFIMMKTAEIDESILAEAHLEHRRPIRKDGTEHWVMASLEDPAPPTCPPDVQEFMEKSGCFGIKTRSADTIRSLQFDLALLGGWREFDGKELEALRRVKTILQTGETPNEYDKSRIAELAGKGFVKVRDGRITMQIPYFTTEQVESLRGLLKESARTHFDDREAKALFLKYAKFIDPYIPAFVDENERRHVATSLDPQAASMYLLVQNGYLHQPDDEQKKRFCTLVWET